MKRRLWVNLGLVLALTLIAVLCYHTGKAYNVIMQNVPFTTADGVEHPALEAAQVTIDNQTAPIYLLDGDRMVGTAVGNEHTLKIEILDDEDKPTDTVVTTFKMTDLDEAKRELNIAKLYAIAKGTISEK